MDLTTPQLNRLIADLNDAGEEITTDVARTIASYWHNGQASAFYAFASSGHYNRAALLGELSDTIAASYRTASSDDRRQLDSLGTYLINRDTFGVVTIRPHGVTIEATTDDFYRWARRPGKVWPCSVLEQMDDLRATFDAHGLVDLNHPSTEYGDDVPADEFNAWSADALEAADLSVEHPAYFIAVGQYR